MNTFVGKTELKERKANNNDAEKVVFS